jgi:uncharacterized protein (TIGR04255 family)
LETNVPVRSRVPIKLERDSIAESIFEIRLAESGPLGDLLPGLLYGSLRSEYPTLVPLLEVPKSLRDSEPALAFAPLRRLKGANRHLSVGDRVVSLSVQKPYPGWSEFKRLISQMVEQVAATGLVRSVEKVALRYPNIFAATDAPALSALVAQFRLSSFSPRETGMLIRAEIDFEGCLAIVQISPQAIAKYENMDPQTGLLVDVDTQMEGPFKNFWSDYPNMLEKLHSVEKRVFFGLLTDKTIDAMGPTWE